MNRRPIMGRISIKKEGKIMKPRIASIPATLFAGASLFLACSYVRAEVDADAAQALAKSNDCFKCHAIDKTKKGPAYKKIAAKYKGKAAEGEEKILKNITTGPKVKLEDGTEEDHKIIDTKDEKQLKNLIGWILSR
jgi:cytochrome c